MLVVGNSLECIFARVGRLCCHIYSKFEVTFGDVFKHKNPKLLSEQVGRNESVHFELVRQRLTTLLRVNSGVIFEALLVSFQGKSDESEMLKLCMLLFHTLSN